MKSIFMVPNPTGTGHNMRMYAIAQELVNNYGVNVTVVLASLQNTFTEMFQKINVNVIDFNPNQIINYSRKSHLSEVLNWSSMIDNYFSPTFFNGSLILRYMSLFNEHQPEVVVSDYNINASMAACFLGIKHVFVTERFNFTLVDVSNDTLKKGGFSVHETEIDDARKSMNSLFQWLSNNTDLILTDKPYVKEMDHNSLIESLFSTGKAKFVGPMIRPIEFKVEGDYFHKLGIADNKGPLIVATVSGTTMFKENKNNLLKSYVELFKRLKNENKDTQMLLLGREELDVPEGIISIPYIQNWIPLLKKCDILLSHPGWITVTEVSALKVPTIFCLPSYKEYHESEAYDRLNALGYVTHYGFNELELYNKVQYLMKERETILGCYESIAPNTNGASTASGLIMTIVNQEKNKKLVGVE